MSDAVWFERAVERIRLIMLWLSGAGTLAVFYFHGWQWSLAFLAGAIASLLNFRWLHQLVDALGAGRRPRKWILVFLALRYLLLGLCGYAIVRYLGVNLTAALIGLFTAVAAVIIEILYELIYAS